MRRAGCFLLVLPLFPLFVAAQTPPPAARSYPGAIRLSVDASQAATSIFRAVETIPVSPGPLTLLYPKWMPGEHGPTGPIVDSTGIKFTANGQAVPWRRDDVDMYAYHLTVPAGVASIDVALEYDAPVAGEGGFSAGASSTAKMAVLSWNWLVLYPAGYAAEQIEVQPSLKIQPSDMWRANEARRQATALSYSIGLTLDKDGRVVDSIVGMPAFAAGITPGMTVVAVNGRRYTPEVVHDALRASKTSKEPIQLLVENDDYFKTYAIDYHDGDRYPQLVRDASKPDLLTEIMKPGAPAR